MRDKIDILDGLILLLKVLIISPLKRRFLRTDHADHVISWPKCLKADNRAMFNAAAQASRAVTFIADKAPRRGTLAAYW